MNNFLQFLADGWWQIIATVIVAYLLGSINFAIIITNIVNKGKDIRTMGSGNAGFTNVLRSVGKVPAIFTIVFDFVKAVIAVIVGGILFGMIVGDSIRSAEIACYGRYLAGLCCMLGHMFPVYFGFRGGKGVVTVSALMAVAEWRVFCVVLGVFLIVFILTKIISLGSLIGAVCYPIVTFIFTFFVDYRPSLQTEMPHSVNYVIISTLFTLFISICVIVKHGENIKRLVNGTEKKITAKK